MKDGCKLCPRRCDADRTSSAGFCGASTNLEVASVTLHRGEEPPLNPIVNVFFAHCNLQCIYCQNYQISQGERSKVKGEKYTVDTLVDQIVSHLSPLTSHLLGFVTAAHYADRIPALLHALRSKLQTALPERQRTACDQRGANCQLPTIVYNSSGYESVDTLRSLEGLIDIYLPDFKYMDSDLARRYSHAPDYPEVATAALQEMIRQVGIGLKIDENGTAYRGLIVRHLVLPGHVENSLAVLDHLAQLPTANYQLPTLSLMAQYYPPRPDLPAPLDRPVTAEEYAAVVAHAENLGLTEGWIQELNARDNYRPDFTQSNPFEN